jgi:hypothetical protein
MPLPTTGPISFSAVAAEIGRAVGSAISLGETAVRNLAGIASGPISLSQLYGKSALSFLPEGGSSFSSPVFLSDTGVGGYPAQIIISCNQPAVWNHTRNGAFGTASVASGSSANSITFSLSNTGFTIRTTTWNVSATVAGVTRYWSVNLVAEGLV